MADSSSDRMDSMFTVSSSMLAFRFNFSHSCKIPSYDVLNPFELSEILIKDLVVSYSTLLNSAFNFSMMVVLSSVGFQLIWSKISSYSDSCEFSLVIPESKEAKLLALNLNFWSWAERSCKCGGSVESVGELISSKESNTEEISLSLL
ncbi:hypothetical protein WICPIJ_006319 [Wickerhamomyces pijperi]|uniref:Uncharacterized protein n=1 Tax=Wickerhamomyces pijperi TaxID=599730 RepID=A0A9P8TKB5_WICPI|nr:hypothetical protein WICPIJ_006319 [Wickerhamomyces pijperi]